jgi:hypothetical protein
VNRAQIGTAEPTLINAVIFQRSLNLKLISHIGETSISVYRLANYQRHGLAIQAAYFERRVQRVFAIDGRNGEISAKFRGHGDLITGYNVAENEGLNGGKFLTLPRDARRAQCDLSIPHYAGWRNRQNRHGTEPTAITLIAFNRDGRVARNANLERGDDYIIVADNTLHGHMKTIGWNRGPALTTS